MKPEFAHKIITDCDLTQAAMEEALMKLTPSLTYLLLIPKGGVFNAVRVKEETEDTYRKAGLNINIYIIVDQLNEDWDEWCLVSINNAIWSPGA